MNPTHQRRRFQLTVLLLLGAAVATLAGLRTGRLPLDPSFLILLVGVLIVGALLELGLTARDGARRAVSAGWATGKVLALAGAIVAGGMGSWNWLAGAQGVLVLDEGETAPLAGPKVARLEAGPLFPRAELDRALRLDRLKLVAGGDGTFAPVSELTALDRTGVELGSFEVGPASVGTLGSLRFYQGAFGFVPRLVVLEGERVVADERVSFDTLRVGATGVAFTGLLAVPSEGMEVRGAIDTGSLGEDMKGHATLALELRKGDALVGEARLLPGHFATFPGGWRVGFAGLGRWSEIDFSRRSLRLPILAGLAATVCGLLVCAASWWRRR